MRLFDKIFDLIVRVFKIISQDKMPENIRNAHKFCSYNKYKLQKDNICGCFYCLNIFNPNEIEIWVDELGETAICPYCGIDSVIGESSGFPITIAFLKQMNKYWFKRTVSYDQFLEKNKDNINKNYGT
jgi:hypothetical protein